MVNYEIVDITPENIDKYGLFCQKSKKKGQGYRAKILWFKTRYKEGLKYKLIIMKANKGLSLHGFIEYIPGEYNWRAINAPGYMVIHCIWVVGQHKGQGLGSKLLAECLQDAQGMNGVAVLTAAKGGWLPTPALFQQNGFEDADTAPPHFTLYVKRFKANARLPSIVLKDEIKQKEYGSGLTFLYCDQCPYPIDYLAPIQEIATKHRIDFRVIKQTTAKEAQQNGVHPYGTYCVLQDGKPISYRPGEMKQIEEKLRGK